MEPLSTEAQARLAAFRRAESPPRGAAERCLAAIEQRLAEGDADVLAFEPRPRSLAAPLLGALALAACALLALHWVVTSGTQAARDDVAAPYHTGDTHPEHLAVPRAPRPRPATARTAGPERPVPEDISPPAEPVPEDTVPEDISSAPAPEDPVPASSADAPDPSTGAPQPAPSGASRARRPDLVAAEVDLLRRAKLADPAARLALLDEHARRFPAGILAAERELLIIETRCALHEVERARHLAARFMRRFPGSPLVERVATICGGPDSTP